MFLLYFWQVLQQQPSSLKKRRIDHTASALGVVSDNLHGIHARIKLLRNAIEQPEGTPDQQQIGGNSADALADLHADLYRIARRFVRLAGRVIAQEHPHQLQQGGEIHLLVELEPGFGQRPGEPIEITNVQRLHHLAQRVDERGGQGGGQPVVEQHQPWAGLHKQVAGMRIRVQDAQMQHLVGIQIIEQPRYLVRGDAGLLQGLAVGNLDAVDVLHHEQTFGTQFWQSRRHKRIRAVRERRAQAGHRLCLVYKVEFGRQRLFQVVDDRLELDGGSEPRNCLDDLLQHHQVRRHQVLDIRVLHLHSNLSSVVQSRAAHLRNRSGRYLLLLDVCKHVCWAPTQLAGDGLLYLRPGARRHAILQGGQRANVDGGEQVGPRGGELAGFNQRTAERGGRLQHPVRAALVLQFPVPRLHQGRQPLRTFTERGIPDEDIRGNGGQHQRARKGLTYRDHARGVFLYLEAGLRPEKCV